MERIGFLEKKIKEQNEEHSEDNQRLVEIIGKSKELFKNLYDNEGAKTLESLNSTLNSTIQSFAENENSFEANWKFLFFFFYLFQQNFFIFALRKFSLHKEIPQEFSTKLTLEKNVFKLFFTSDLSNLFNNKSLSGCPSNLVLLLRL